MVGQLTNSNPAAAMPAPITPPTMEWVVETGAFSKVARLIHSAAANNALNIKARKVATSIASPGEMIPFETVLTTSPPARMAPALSQTAAIRTAMPTVRTRPPTAGPILLATSLAPMFSAIYPPMTAAMAMSTQSSPKRTWSPATNKATAARNTTDRPAGTITPLKRKTCAWVYRYLRRSFT